VPAWIKEGSAMFCAEQGVERTNFVFATTTGKDPEALINGLDGGHSLEDYPEDYLAFEYIEQTFGLEKVHAIIAGIVANKPHQEVIAQVLGVTYEEFCGTAKAYAVVKVQEWKNGTAGYSDFRKGIELFRNRKYSEAIAELDKAIAQCTEPHILAVAQYHAGRAHVIEGRLAEAGKYLEQVARATRHTVYADRAIYYPTLMLYTATVQKMDEASPDTLRQIEGNFQAVIRDFPYSGQVHECYYYLGHLYARTKDHKEAAMMFEAYTQAFKNGVYAQASYYNAALNLLELGEKEKALEMARKALKGHSEQVSKQAEELVARLEAEGK
jgi:TolA-binding protein